MYHVASILPSIGNITLNISFVLYLIVYIPQIIHNQKATNIEHLSLGLHFLLYAGYFFDLFYGFSSHFPWQYITVSIVGLLLMKVQHLQLTALFVRKRLFWYVIASVLLFIINGIALYYFFIFKHRMFDTSNTFIVGYCFPQIIKNYVSKSAHAISINYVYLNLLLALLDTTSAWCLNWGWPNKLAAPISAVLMIVMLCQNKIYTHSNYWHINVLLMLKR